MRMSAWRNVCVCVCVPGRGRGSGTDEVTMGVMVNVATARNIGYALSSLNLFVLPLSVLAKNTQRFSQLTLLPHSQPATLPLPLSPDLLYIVLVLVLVASA